MNILGLLISFGLLLIAMTFHEFSHGWAAYKLGDTTAARQGRLTLNPLAHIDPVGTVLLPILLFITTNGQFVFGAAKPVPINYYALRNPRRDMLLIGLAGPLSNIILAALLSVILKGLNSASLAAELIRNLAFINIILGVFNLLPIPPLDGSRVVAGLLPDSLAQAYNRLEPYGFIIIIGLMALGILNILIWPAIILTAKALGIYI
ncbi:MAG: site-2 protease family protein [Candidatus Omnitrophica bacterium]|nr:site-2 protease family protein [Candidatus Omnitrophota bacterium]MDD5655001.1 site-2 protease family protein [Candidatus Omnitrophota bacterium]